jgi:hypothetical protein
MAIVATHKVPGTTVTITITQLLRGFMVMSVGDPRLQSSQKVRDIDAAKAAANTMWQEARERGGPKVTRKAVPGTQVVIEIQQVGTRFTITRQPHGETFVNYLQYGRDRIEDARAVANFLWTDTITRRDARLRRDELDDRAFDALIQRREIANDRAAAAAKMGR